MVTRMNLPTDINLTSDFVGFVVGLTNITRSKNVIKVFIPALMPDIQRSSVPKTETRQSDAMKSMILNASDCRPNFNTRHISANYIEAKPDGDTDWDERAYYLKREHSWFVPDKTIVECWFNHDKLSMLLYDMDSYATGHSQNQNGIIYEEV